MSSTYLNYSNILIVYIFLSISLKFCNPTYIVKSTCIQKYFVVTSGKEELPDCGFKTILQPVKKSDFIT